MRFPTRQGPARGTAGTLILVAGLLFPPGLSLAEDSERCLVCHGDASLAVERGRRTVSLHVDARTLEGSAHAALGCEGCHAGLDPEAIPHAATIPRVDCATCHADAPETHRFHPEMAAAASAGTAPGVDCVDCHGSHAVESPRAPGSRTSASRQPEGCGACHADASAAFEASAHGQALAEGAPGAPSCVGCHVRPIHRSGGGADPAAVRIAQEKLCLSCHLDDPEVRARMVPSAGFVAAYEASVHGAALLAGNAEAANCVDCHGSHEMRKGMDPGSRVHKARIPETCARCHGAIAWQYAESVHAEAVRRGQREAPVCTDCHGEHGILRHGDPKSPVAPRNVSARVCTPCHSSLALSEKYGIAADRSRSFEDSYHGLAIRGGSVAAANCASCHGAHDIRPSSDPASRVHKANLAATCGTCHPGANERFAVGAVHVVVTAEEEPVLYWIAVLYVGMIVVVIGGMAAHNLLDFGRKVLARLRGGAGGAAPAGEETYERMTAWERLQHGALAASFVVLAVTGFMLRYPDAWWVAALRRTSDRLFELRSLAHRAAAVVMLVASVAHVAYVAFTARGRQLVRDLLPTRQDFRDVGRMLRYNLGLSRSHPHFGRFSYIEKSEYWALVWGTIVMAATGVVLWFENTFVGLFTKTGADVARAIHFYEAWLATLAIAIWHLYFVVFNPDVYPMSPAWLTGRIGERQMEREHPRELEAIRRRRTNCVPRRGGSSSCGAARTAGRALARQASAPPDRPSRGCKTRLSRAHARGGHFGSFFAARLGRRPPPEGTGLAAGPGEGGGE